MYTNQSSYCKIRGEMCEDEVTTRPISIDEARRKSRIDQFTKALAVRDKLVRKKAQAERARVLAQSDEIFNF